MRKIKFFAFLVCILVLFNALPFVAFAQTQQDIITEQKAELKKADVPELLSFEQARESGHTLRLHSKEDSNTVVFQNQDGTETMYLFDETIKYTDKDGKTFDKSNKLTEVSEGTFKNLSNDISVTYPKQISDGVSVEHKDFTLKLVPVISSTSKQVGSFKENDTQISYAGAFGSGTKLVYSQTFSGFKEDIILYTPPLKNSFEFWVYTESTLLKDSSGRVAAYNDNEKVGEFGDIVIYDANNVYAFGTTDLEYVKDGVYKLTVNVPAEYLADENRVYPVTVDPTFNLDMSTGNMNFIDATLYSASNDCFSDYFTMFVGNFDLWVSSSADYRGTARSVINFTNLYTHSMIQNYYTTNRLASVELMLTVYRAPVNISVQAHHVWRGWSEENIEYNKDLMYSDSTSFYKSDVVNITACNYGVNPQYAFDITYIVVSQLADITMPKQGVMLKATDESKQAVCFNTSESGGTSGTASARPYIRVTYTSAMPTTETTGIESGGTYNITNAMTNAANDTEYDVAMEYRNAGLCLYGHSPGNFAQAFTITYESNGKYIITQASSGRRLTANGEYVTLETASNSDLQRWYIIPSGNGYKFVNAVYKLKQINIPYAGVVGLSEGTTNAVWKLQRVFLLDVPLDKQDTTGTCNVACAKMVLHYYGYTDVTEGMLITAAGTNYNVVYHLTIGMNYYFDYYDSGITYEYEFVTGYTQAQYQSVILNQLSSGHPVIAQIWVTDSTYFPYMSTDVGHYVVIIGAFYDEATSQYMFIINDPHHTYCNQYKVPMASMYTYTMAHSGLVIHKD